jgi:UDP-galactopyranose mutase
MKVLVVGAGFSGVTVARILAENNIQVDVIDQRDHVGGNAFDYVNEHGITVHKYGAHVFHTNNERVFNWLGQFTTWVQFEHRVKAMLSTGELVTFPPNRETLAKVPDIIGTFYKPYTEKMWGVPFETVSKGVVDRVKVRDDDSESYFHRHKIHAVPEYGYVRLFERMLDHENIKVNLNTPFDISFEQEYDHVFASMPIDQYYNCKFGKLPYRSLDFHTVHLPFPRVFPVSVVNFTHTGPETRVIEWKNFPVHGVNDHVTTLTYETPRDAQDWSECYYPVDNEATRNLYKQYSLIENEKVTFIGRCGKYVYIDMDQAVNQGISVATNFLRKTK